MRTGTHNPLATDAGDKTVTDYYLIRGGVAAIPLDSYYKTSCISPLPFTEGFLEGRPHRTTYHTHKPTQDVADVNGKGIGDPFKERHDNKKE